MYMNVYNLGKFRLIAMTYVYKMIFFGLIPIHICNLEGTGGEKLKKFHKIVNGLI